MKLKTFSITIYGCQMNYSDAERIKAFLISHNFKYSKNPNKAALNVLVTCGVRQTAENRVFHKIHNLKKSNPQTFVILTGCLAERKDVQQKMKSKVDLFTNIKNFFNQDFHYLLPVKGGSIRVSREEKCIPFKHPALASDETRNEEKAGVGSCNYLKINPDYQHPEKISIPIMSGCNNFCSYCVVPYARGREISRPINEIITEIKKAAKNKKLREITLLGQNVNSYSYIPVKTSSRKINRQSLTSKAQKKSQFKGSSRIGKTEGFPPITFPILLEKLAQEFPKITFKFLTSHPKDFSCGLIETIKTNQNIERKIHLPLQSGSDKILKAMNRPYTQKHYLKIITKIKKTIPDTQITTDVIIGFPGETEKEFNETVKVFKKVKFSKAFLNKYSPRPGTEAFKLGDPIAWKEKKQRAKILAKLIQ
ncbi:MAG: MiaB/RimO family radical SAM methylthiotransferase [Candidatus Moranbacteria bacterium]|nr:MiaB/RimO family radical SAM methylthiotransferase [Candidatus Moranbacteria bacterium]